MTEEFISVQDRIISASIDIVSDAGLASLNYRNISLKTNISEDMLYKYYSSTDEILVDIVNSYFKFDKSIIKTIDSKESTYVEKIGFYIDSFSSYYNSYYSLSAIMLQMEELLHNTYTREIVESYYLFRRQHFVDLFENAIKNKEIVNCFTAEQLADQLLGYTRSCFFNRRVMTYKKSIKEELMSFYKTWINTLKVI
ncbi:MAG: TetR/AcrR family transcriptional regulator [Eubacterium sp.]|nr:TetR/AcrR family transcriptional regulator [Eubacterium sp.]